MELIPIQELLRGSNVTVFEKHELGTSLYGKRARYRAKMKPIQLKLFSNS